MLLTKSKRRCYLYALISVILLYASCKKKLDYKLPELPPKRVMNSILNTDSAIKVFVSTTQNITARYSIHTIDSAEEK